MWVVDGQTLDDDEASVGNRQSTVDNSTLMLTNGALPELLSQLPVDELLDLLDDAADEDMRQARVDNTRAAYAQDWAAWAGFCAILDVDPLTVRAGLFYAFVKYLEGFDYAPSTVDRRLAGVVVGLRDRGAVIPDKGGPAAKARAECAAYRVRLKAANVELGRGQAPPLMPEQIRVICDRIQPGLHGLRQRALLLIAVHIMARRSEMAKLLVSDIVVDPRGRGIEVTARASKGGKTRTVAIAYGQNPATCPVRAWLAWHDAAGLLPDGPAFCQIRGRKTFTTAPAKGITGQLAGHIIGQSGALIGVDLVFTGHSVRRGAITAAFENGADVKDVTDISGHSLKSGTVYDYRVAADRWRNQANRLGL